jgi:ATP-dependent helicase/nuclease subunit B
MLLPLIDIALFRDAIEQDYLIITPNHRLAAKISEAWSLDCQTRNSVWRTPRVFAIDHWLKHCWDELQDQNNMALSGKAVVGSQQSRYYWERAINENDPDLSSQYAKMVSQTYSTLEQWDLTVDQVHDDTPAITYLRRWSKSYRHLLRMNTLLTPAESWQSILKAFQEGLLSTETTILTYGFQSQPPLIEKLLNTASPNTRPIESDKHRANSHVVTAVDHEEELRSVASWAAQKLTQQPNQRIGIVIPDLNNSLAKVARIVNEALGDHATESVVNISAGTPLSQTSIVNSALGLIDCLNSKKALQKWLEILYSPHNLFDQLSVQSRVNAELGLRKTRRFEHSFGEFFKAVCPDNEAEVIPDSLAAVAHLRDTHSDHHRLQQNFTAWAGFFSSHLNNLGWPGKRTLNSLEYQQKEHWQRLLEQFSGLDNLGIEIGFTTALKHLRRLAQDAVFHPKTADAPLQILGLLEASGLRFDSLWVLGMDSQNFPASVAINPLLPAAFQRQHVMPHSLPERELEIARQLLLSYINNSDELILSYASKKGEETLRPSPLISDIPCVALKHLVSDVAQYPKNLMQVDQAHLFEDYAPRFDKAIESISTGVSLFKNQAACPFNAFAIHRLKAASLEEPSHGLTPSDRGTILHDILFRLWTQWGTSRELHQQSDQEIDLRLEQVATEILDDWSVHHPILRGERYRKIEKTRLIKLLWEWIVLEKQRPNFSIEALEKKQKVTFGDLDVSFRLDRIDRIDDKLLIIDYKSGAINPSHWHGERPKDPQLPLYVSATETLVNGCAFAQIIGGKIRFTGISDSLLIEGEKASGDWEQSVSQWHSSISLLAHEFTAGVAQMEVIHPSGVIYHTHLLPLNRWSEESIINKIAATAGAVE